MTTTRTYAEWALGLVVPEDVRHAATLRILDGLGCGVAAATRNEAPYLDIASGFGSSEEASIIGGAQASAPAAALANGTLIHALDFDDTHDDALIHATAVILPAALAVAQQVHAGGSGLIDAVVAGYEVALRIGMGVRHGFHARGFHATSVCGVFGATLAASKLLGLSEDKIVSAMGIAGSTAAGSLEFLHTGSSTKQLHPGLAAMNAIVATRLAAAGAEGPASILEGEYGLFNAYVGVAPKTLTDGLGSKWETLRIGVKRYPACRLSHQSLDALGTVLPRISTEHIEAVTFDIPEGSVPIVCEPVANKRAPRTSYEAKFSLPFSAAALAVDGTLTIESFDEEKLDRKDVLALAERVTHHPLRDARAPAAVPGSVTVMMRDGTVHRGASDGRVVTDEEIIEKFLANGGSQTLADRVLALGELADVRSLLS